MTRSAVTGTEGDPRVTAVHVAGAGGATEPSTPISSWSRAGGTRPCSSGAPSEAACATTRDRACFVPDGTGPAWLSTVGGAAGDVPTSVPFWFTPGHDLSRHFVDLQRDSTVADVIDALGHDLRSVEHVKRATYIGTAVDQGRTSGVLTAEIVNQLQNAGPGAQGPTNARPPYTPIPYSVLAGRDRGPLLDPARVTPIHPWHVAHGAVFENVGQWKRPWFFPAHAERGPARRRATRMPGRAQRGGRHGRVDPGQDRGRRPRRRPVPGPRVHEQGLVAARRLDPVLDDAGAGRHGVRRRRGHAPDRRPLSADHHHGRRRPRAGPSRGVAPVGVAGPSASTAPA